MISALNSGAGAGAVVSGAAGDDAVCADATRGPAAITASARDAARMLRSSLGIRTLPIAF